MRTFFIFVVIACTFSHTREKPLRVLDGQTRDAGEAEYENNDDRTAEDDYGQDDQEALIEDQGGRADEQRDAIQGDRAVEMNPYKRRASNLQPAGLSHLDKFAELSASNRGVRNDRTTNTNIDSNQQPLLRYRQPDAYPENNEQDAAHHLSDGNYKVNQDQSPGFENNINKRAMLSFNANEEGDLLFENQKEQENKLDKGEFSRENTDANMHAPYSKFYTVPAENRDFPEYKKYEKLRLNINRDRRQVEENANLKETNEPTISPEENENEESAIKRHVKKLSEQELEELFNTLTEDKRNLLKKILDSDFDYDSEAKNKREITKKAGAVEENSYIENGQLDSSKNQGVSSNVEDINTESSISQETTENNKRTMSSAELGDVVSSKTGEKSENKAELVSQSEDIKETKAESNLDLDSKKSDTEIESMSNSQTEEVKTESKRAANASELATILKTPDDTKSPENDLNPKDNKGSENNQEMFSNDGEVSEVLNEDTEQHTANKNTIKREVYFDESPNFSDSFKSLEESFPNSNAYDESNTFLGSEMAPLVRVKRRNAESAMVKRAANVIADSNVPYFPNKGENDDEDNDEGSEFDEDGFYDRTSNYARNNVNKPFESNNPKAEGIILKQKSGRYYDNESNNLDSDTMSLGSDTDNAMTGVEGVNDNLMYSSGSRNRRALDDIENVYNSSEDRLVDVANERCRRSTPLDDSDAVTVTENYMNVPGYQENDAFGPLPRNYDGDLGRYKRIRRVKQSPVLTDNAS